MMYSRFFILLLMFPLSASAWTMNCLGGEDTLFGGMYSNLMVNKNEDGQFVGVAVGSEYNFETTVSVSREHINTVGGKMWLVKGHDGTEVYIGTAKLEKEDGWTTSKFSFLMPAGKNYAVKLFRCSYK